MDISKHPHIELEEIIIVKKDNLTTDTILQINEPVKKQYTSLQTENLYRLNELYSNIKNRIFNDLFVYL
jgi:hypothetical protein